MDKNWYINESVWSLSFFYPDLQEDLKEKEKKNQALKQAKASFKFSPRLEIRDPFRADVSRVLRPLNDINGYPDSDQCIQN